MYAYDYTRKSKKGRPFKFKPAEKSYLEIKKSELFEKHEANKEAMNLINLAYHFGKLTKEEYDIAAFLESIHMKVQKNLGIKKLPSSSPNTWETGLRSVWQVIGSEDTKAQNCWKKIKDFLTAHDFDMANEFFSIITTHHSYEELIGIKKSTFAVTNTLKQGLQLVNKMFDLKII